MFVLSIATLRYIHYITDVGLSVPMTVDLFVKSCVGFTIYFYCCLLVSNLNSLNNIDE